MFTKKLSGKSSLVISENLQAMRCLEKEEIKAVLHENFHNLEKFTGKASKSKKRVLSILKKLNLALVKSSLIKFK